MGQENTQSVEPATLAHDRAFQTCFCLKKDFTAKDKAQRIKAKDLTEVKSNDVDIASQAFILEDFRILMCVSKIWAY